MSTTADAGAGTRGPSLGRASALGALGTVGSRLTGFLRTVVVAAAVGTAGFAESYNVANTTPNIVYDLLLGGVLTSVVVPVLVRAHAEDDDGGVAFSQALLSAVALALTVVAALAVLAAPLLVDLYLGSAAGAKRDQAVLFTRFFLPQLVAYGITATAGAVLTTRGRFGRDSAVPVLNNLVVVATAVVFVLMQGPARVDTATVSHSQVLVLAVGTTLGVAVMAMALLPSLRSAGVPWRWRWDLPRHRLASSARLAGWVVVAVLVTQAGFAVVTRLASDQGLFSTYSFAYQLFQLPYAIVGVSVVAALLPAMSRHAATGRTDRLRAEVSRGLRLAGVLVVPAALGLAALAVPLAVATFHGQAGGSRAVLIGRVLAVFALGLVPFTVQQILLRSFFAAADSRTPALLTTVVTVVLVALDTAVATRWDGAARVVGLAGGFAAAYAVGAVVTGLLVRRRLGGRGRRVVRLYVRVSAVSAAAVGAGWLAARGVAELLSGTAGALAQLGAAGVLAPPLYLAGLRVTRVRELDPLLAPIRRRLAR